MKKTLKRALTALIAAALLLSCLPLSSSADDLWVDADVDALWEKKIAGDETQWGYTYGEASMYFCHMMGNDLTVLLYTEAFQKLKFERREYNYAMSEDGEWWSVLGDAELIYLPSYHNSYMYSEELHKVLAQNFSSNGIGADYDDFHVPYLRLCIEAFGITKEELKAACQKSYTDPDSIREVLSIFTDEEFESMKKSGELQAVVGNTYTQEPVWLEDHFVFDALYLEDENEMRALCMHYFTTDIAGKTIRVDSFMYDVAHGTEDYLWLKEQNLSREGFRMFLKNAKRGLAGAQYDEVRAEMEVRFAELEALAYADPPKTGDPTAAYALIFTLAALPLAGFGVAEWKRRRRAV